jgi:RNA polymerase sigma factor (sigma-70 family)
MKSRLETLVEQAKKGDKVALEEVMSRIRPQVYKLAKRVLAYPIDAEDATQEILIKIITHLNSFRQKSAFRTWIHRIAFNHLLTICKRQAQHKGLNFEYPREQPLERFLGTQLEVGLQVPSGADQELLVEETKISYAQGILSCLNRSHRLAYILGEIFEVTGEEGGYILEITPLAFRKRLSRARIRIRAFLQNEYDSIRKDPVILEGVQELEELKQIAIAFRSHIWYGTPDVFVENIKKLIDSGKFKVFEE